MDITLHLDSLQKGTTFVKEIDGETVIFQIIDVKSGLRTDPHQQTLKKNRDSIQSKLKGSILKDDDPFGPAVPDEDWEAYRS